jgi:hypothetical protein
MKVKSGVQLGGVQRNMYYAAGVVDQIHKDVFGTEATITSGTDGKHMESSLHYKGLALDFRTIDIGIEDADNFVFRVKKALDPHGFDVVFEKGMDGVIEHLHVEFDPKWKEKIFNGEG